MIPIDRYVKIKAQPIQAFSDEITLEFFKPVHTGQTFACVTIRKDDIGQLLSGEFVEVKFRMWEEPDGPI